MMFGVARWEMADHLNSPRVVSFALLLLVLFPAVTALRLGNHADAVRDTKERVRAQEQCLRKYAHYNRIASLAQPVLPPARLELLFEPAPVELDLERETLETDPLKRLLNQLDLGFVVTFLLPLWTLLVAQAAASDERASGRLGLLVSQPVSRMSLLLGKWLGIVLPGAIILGLGLLLAAAVAMAHASIVWGPLEWWALVLVLAAGLLYLAFVAAAGILLGTVIPAGDTATLAALSLWVLFEVIVPAVAPSIADVLHPLPERAAIERNVERLLVVEREAKLREAMGPFRDLPEQEAWDAAGADGINREYFARAARIRADHRRHRETHRLLVRSASAVSPSVSLRSALMELGGVGISRAGYVLSTASSWQAAGKRYLDERFREAVAADPEFTAEDRLDVSDGPRFHYTEEPLRMRLSACLPYAVYLFILGALTVVAAGITFSRTDPRPEV